MLRQNLLVLCILVVTLTGCHQHRRHPHAFRQSGLNGCCEHHHGHCQKCGRHSGRRHAGYGSLFPGDVYGQCGEGFPDGGCGTGFMECGGCGLYQSCNACEMPYANSCHDCGCFAGGASYGSCTGCSNSGMALSSPAASSASTQGCNCGQQHGPTGSPQQFLPSVPQQSLPPVPRDATPLPSAEPDINANETLPSQVPPAALPPIDPVSWEIPRLP